MSNKNFEDAKAVFDKYDGSYYQMVRDGQYEKYKTILERSSGRSDASIQKKFLIFKEFLKQ